MNEADIAVIVPTFARPTILSLVLEGLCQQTEPESMAEVVVVCDGGAPETKEAAQAFEGRLPLRYMVQPKRGVSAARNVGVTAAASPVVLLLDDDVIPGPTLIAEHCRFHRENSAVNAALLGYVGWHPELDCTPFMRWYGEYGGLFAFSRLENGKEVDPRFFYSCNVSLKREFLRAHGGFDESLIVMEDNELGFRLAQQGLRLFHWKAAAGFHYQKFTFAQACQRLERYSPGLDAFLRTPAGRAMAKLRNGTLFRIAEAMVRITAPMLGFLRPSIDGDRAMPHAVYRLLYWYYGSYRSFWGKADRRLLDRG